VVSELEAPNSADSPVSHVYEALQRPTHQCLSARMAMPRSPLASDTPQERLT
jgi:hypothetical protein